MTTMTLGREVSVHGSETCVFQQHAIMREMNERDLGIV